jgi:hypothetical protein
LSASGHDPGKIGGGNAVSGLPINCSAGPQHGLRSAAGKELVDVCSAVAEFEATRKRLCYHSGYVVESGGEADGVFMSGGYYDATGRVGSHTAFVQRTSLVAANGPEAQVNDVGAQIRCQPNGSSNVPHRRLKPSFKYPNWDDTYAWCGAKDKACASRTVA